MRAEQWATAELGLLAPELKPACHEATAKAWGHTPITKTDPAMPDLGRASEPRRSRAKGIAVVTGGLLLALCLVAVCVRAPAPALMAASVDPSPARTPFPHPRPYSSHPVAQGASFLRGRKAVSAVRPHKPPGPAPSRGRAGPARSGTGRSPHRHPFIVEAAPWGLVVIAGYALCRYFWSGSTLPGKWAHRGFAGIIANADRECVPGSWGRYRQLILRDGPPAPSGAPTAGNAPGFAFAVLSIASGHKITKRKGVKRLSQLEKLKRKLASVPQFKGVAYDRNAQRDEPPPPSPVPYEWRDELRRRAEVVQALAVPQEQEPENIDDRGFRKRWVHFARPHIGGNTFGKIDWHLKENMYSVIVDMRDARTPASSTHPYLERLAGMASVHIIGYTHAEFLSESEIARVLLWTEATYGKDTPVFFFDLSHGKRMRPNKHRNVFRLFYQCLLHSCRVGWTSRVLFVGVPNTGKSAIIGPLVRKLVKERRKAYVNYHIPRVGAEPGMTKGIYPYPFVREPKACSYASVCLDKGGVRGGGSGSRFCVGNFAFQIGREIYRTKSRGLCDIFRTPAGDTVDTGEGWCKISAGPRGVRRISGKLGGGCRPGGWVGACVPHIAHPTRHNISGSVREIYHTKSRGFAKFSEATFTTQHHSVQQRV